MRYSYVNLVSCTAAAATGISFGVKNHGINSTKEINTIIFCRKFIRWRKISVGILRIEIHLVHKRNAVICRSFPWNWNEYDVNWSELFKFTLEMCRWLPFDLDVLFWIAYIWPSAPITMNARLFRVKCETVNATDTPQPFVYGHGEAHWRDRTSKNSHTTRSCFSDCYY